VPNLVFELGHRGYQVVVARDAVVGYPVEYGELVVKHTLSMVCTLATTDQLLAVWS